MSSSFLRESNEGDDAYLRFSILTGRTLKYNDTFFQITLDESIMKYEIFYFAPLELVRVESMKMKMIVFYKCVQFKKRIYLIRLVTLLIIVLFFF